MQQIEAFELACELHRGQQDKAGKPYIEHLVRVMLRVQGMGGSSAQQIAALLHDSLEDGHATADLLLQRRVPEQAVSLVQALTRPHGQRYLEYIAHVKRNPGAALIKTADLADNADPARLALLPEADASRLRTKYERASQVLFSNQEVS